MSGRFSTVVLFLSCLLKTHESFRHSSRYHRYLTCRESSSNFANDFETLSSICRTVAVTTNSTATLINFIQLGDSWATETNKRTSSEFDRFKKGDKVPGCMADVRITTSFRYPDKLEGHQKDLMNSAPDPTITIDGTADSRVAQGILALLCKGLENQRCSSVMTLSPTAVSRECGLNVLLPVGRLNGLHNMVTLIQNQIACEIQRVKTLNMQDKTESIEPSDKNVFKSDTAFDETRDTSDEVAVLLSGGVDSSVALKLLQLQGHKLRAFYLKIWLEDEVAHLNECPWEEDLGYAESVCAQLNIPLETLSLQKEYWEEVVQYTFREARAGRTPNPDVLCNSRIKFGMFYKYVGKHYAKIATGHYAQVLYGDENVQKNTELIEELNKNTVSKPSSVIEVGDSHNEDIGRSDVEEKVTSRIESIQRVPSIRMMSNSNPLEARLVMSPDSIKDQTYFLSALSQEQLAKAIFPIGHLRKHEVRELAEEYQLPTRARKDSQGICFLGKLKFDEFIEHYLGENEGPIRCYRTGKVLGQHRGLWFHTIGQRKGLGRHLQSVVHDGPWFVAGKDASSNTVYVTNDLALIERPRIEFRVHKMNWLSGVEPAGLQDPGGLQIDIKLRHGPNLSCGTVTGSTQSPASSSSEDMTERILNVVLTNKDKGIAPGQFAAFYCGSECLGAGIILDTAEDEIIRQEEHISVAKPRNLKSPNARSAIEA